MQHAVDEGTLARRELTNIPMPKPSKDKPEKDKDKKPAKAEKPAKKATKTAKPAKSKAAEEVESTKPEPAEELEIVASEPDAEPEIDTLVETAIVETTITETIVAQAPAAPAAPTAPPSGGYQRRPKPVKPALPANVQEIVVARAKYTVTTHSDGIEVSRPRKRDPKNPRTYKFSLKGCEIARRHLAGRRVTLADSAALLKAVKVSELDNLEGEARRQATKFLLVALSSRTEAQLERDGDLILVHVPFMPVDLGME